MHIAVDPSAEAAGIGRKITRHRAGGVPYCDQALLCRSHPNLARFAELLELQGIPSPVSWRPLRTAGGTRPVIVGVIDMRTQALRPAESSDVSRVFCTS